MRLPRLYASWWCPFANRATLACHLKGLENGKDYEYRETMPYKRKWSKIRIEKNKQQIIGKDQGF